MPDRLLRRFNVNPRIAWRAGVLYLLLAAPVAAADVPATGSTGWGLSVFRGTEPERFEVEILGSIEGMGSTGTTILARLSGAGLEHSGVQQGMSGSPVYVDGELIGAVMSAWGFAKDPIAAIRPIDEMRELADDQRPAGEQPGAKPLAWNAAGLSADAVGALGNRLGVEIQTAGRGTSTSAGSGPLEPGDAMAVLLVDGDAKLFATGTVTERIDDRILGFAHPFLSAGDVSLPMARAEVVTVIASTQISFKLAAAGEVVGALELDRRAGVAGRLGATADTLPVGVRVHGAGTDEQFVFTIARLRGLTPQLVGWTALSALNDRQAPGNFAAARIEVEVELDGAEPLRSRTVAAGRQISSAAANEAALLTGLLEGLVGEVPRTSAVKVDVHLDPHEPVAVLGRAKVRNPRLEPGVPIEGRVEVLGQDGSSEWLEFRVPVPARLLPGMYRLRITDGVTNFADELQRSVGRYERMDLAALRQGLRIRGAADRIVAVLYGPPESVVVGDAEFRALPPSMHALLASPGAGPVATETLAEVLGRWEGAAPSIVSGEVFVDLKTREPAANGVHFGLTPPQSEQE